MVKRYNWNRLNVNPLHTNCQPVYDLGAKDSTKKAILCLISSDIKL